MIEASHAPISPLTSLLAHFAFFTRLRRTTVVAHRHTFLDFYTGGIDVISKS